MRTLLLSGAVMAGHVATVVALYYLGISGDHPIIETDVVILYLPTLLAFGLHFAVMRHPARTVRVIAATIMTLIGFVVAMLISLNSWGS
jgi:hypothetical protein